METCTVYVSSRHIPLYRFPGLTRGLVAVLLYHDGRRSIVSSLRSLVQVRDKFLSPPPATCTLWLTLARFHATSDYKQKAGTA